MIINNAKISYGQKHPMVFMPVAKTGREPVAGELERRNDCPPNRDQGLPRRGCRFGDLLGSGLTFGGCGPLPEGRSTSRRIVSSRPARSVVPVHRPSCRLPCSNVPLNA
jgi:hypothetical protein